MNFQKLIETYLDMEAYGSNLIIKRYCGFPRFLPLPSHMEHGWTPLPNALVTDLEIAAYKKMMMVYSTRREKAWAKKSKIAVEIMGSPFMLYRRMNNIVPKKDAKGTIAFPSHSTIFLKSEYDIDSYCQKLKSLPKEFHPITICLLYPDIKLGRDKAYRKYGFDVVSAGKKLRGSIEFVRNFYNILSNYKYATSNEVGSYSFYSIDLGLPFFLYGEEPVVLNKHGVDRNIGKTAKISDYVYGGKAIELFGNSPSRSITAAQKEFVRDELGEKSGLNPSSMKKVLFRNTKFMLYWLYFTPAYWLISFAKMVFPDKLAYLILEKLNKKS